MTVTAGSSWPWWPTPTSRTVFTAPVESQLRIAREGKGINNTTKVSYVYEDQIAQHLATFRLVAAKVFQEDSAGRELPAVVLPAQLGLVGKAEGDRELA